MFSSQKQQTAQAHRQQTLTIGKGKRQTQAKLSEARYDFSTPVLDHKGY